MQIARYGINGVSATLIHYLALYLCIEVLNVKYAGVANSIASIFGISVSFLGNRYFVFKSNEGNEYHQFLKFTLLYSVIAIMHGATLYFWTDVYRLSYNVGFAIAVSIQFILGYSASKYLIFNR